MLRTRDIIWIISGENMYVVINSTKNSAGYSGISLFLLWYLMRFSILVRDTGLLKIE